MTWIVLASVEVDHPHQSLRKLSLSISHSQTTSSASRPGTPIVTPRTAVFSAHASPSRPPSRQASVNLPIEEPLQEVGEEDEEVIEEEEEEPKEHEVLRRRVSQDYPDDVDLVEDLLSSVSGISLSSGSEADTVVSLPPPSTPPTVRENLQQAEFERSGSSVSCGQPNCRRGQLRGTSRALTAASSSYKTRHSKYCNCTSGHHLNEVAMVDAQVIYASSHDPKFPPSAAVDGRRDTFWISSGLYPQFLVVSLPGLTAVENVNIIAYNVRKISVARSIKKQPTDFEEISKEELTFEEGKLQESPVLSQNVSAIFLRITIEEGYDHFCAVHKVSVKGSVSQPNRVTSVSPVKPAPIQKPDPPPSAVEPPIRKPISVNEVPRYQRPQSPEQIISNGPTGLTTVASLAEDEDISEYGYQNTTVSSIRNIDDDDDEF